MNIILKDRMPVPNENASVTAEFLINEDFYQVKHNLYNNKLVEVYKNENQMGKRYYTKQ